MTIELGHAPGRAAPDGVTWITVYLLLLLAIPTRLVLAPLGSAGAPSQLFAAVTLAWWAWYQLSLWRENPVRRARPAPVRTALGLFLLSIGFSYVTAMAGPIAADEVSPADVALLSVAGWAGVFLVAHDGIDSRNRLQDLLRVLTVGAGFMALLGIAQFVTGQILVDRISIPGLAGIEANTFAREGFTRPSGTATHPIEYGAVLTMLLPFTLHYGFHASQGPWVVRWLPALTVAVVIPMSLSRSALLGTAVCLLVLIPTWPRARRRTVLAGVAALTVVMFLTVPGLIGSIRGLFVGIEDDPSIESRTGSYALAEEFVGAAPLFGRGLGTFLPKYWILDNQLLLLLITIGFVGVAAFFGVILTALTALVRVRRSLADPAERDLAQSMIASILAGTCSLALFDAFSFPMTAGTLFLVLGTAGAYRRLADELRPRSHRTRAGGPHLRSPDAARARG